MRMKPKPFFEWTVPGPGQGAARSVAQGRVVKRSTFNRPLSTTQCATITQSKNGTVSGKHAMRTRGATRAAARNAVFNTQELLEEILKHLPTEGLFAIERVCSHWRLTAKTSPRLKREKFLKIVKNHTLLYLDKTCKIVKKQDPTDLTRFGAAWLARQTTIHTSTLNAVLFRPAHDSDRQALVDRCVLCETITFQAQPNLASAWSSRNMVNHLLVANPPPMNAELEVAFAPMSMKKGRKARFAGAYTVQPERHTIQNEQGVTWADVVKELDVVLFCKNAKRPPGTKELAIDAEKCKIWMRGIVFPTDEEMRLLDSGGVLGKKTKENRGSVVF